MDDDDEFGDLYADVLLPAATLPVPSPNKASVSTVASEPPPPPPVPSPRRDGDGNGDEQVFGAPDSGNLSSTSPARLPALSVVPGSKEGGDDDWILGRALVSVEQPVDWDDGLGEGLSWVSSAEATDLVPQPGVSRFLMEEEDDVTGVTQKPRKQVGKDEDGIGDAEDGGDSVQEKEDARTLGVDDGVADLVQEPRIPGLCVTSLSADGKVSRSNEWDSDSEDDLRIVLNDDNLGRMGGDGKGVGVVDEDDEDGEEDLVIVTDEDHHHHLHHHHQGMEEQGLDDESMQQALDGERKEKSDVAKENGGIGTASLAKVGYNCHGYHGQNHSQFKYIRPGVAAIPGGAAAGTGATSGQLRPPLTMGPIAGQGRGAQKSFHSGYGLLVWSSSTSARAYGGGLEFSLPSHKTIFDIDVDGFEEKPWRLPGIDISDFFNFGLNEDKWRDFCKQLEQLRLEATMQSKILVYESGRSEQHYDPDLPPELAAATGLKDISAESTHGKADSGQPELIGHGRGALCLRAQLPIGRAIQVESGFGERLPSIDTRPRRMRDSDAIIEIVLQDSVDVCGGASDQQCYEPQGQVVKDDHERRDDNKHVDSESFDHFPPACNGRKRELVKRKGSPMGSVDNNGPERDGILPFTPDASTKSFSNSKFLTPVISGDQYGASHAARQTQSTTGVECSNDAVTSHSLKSQIYDHQGERSENSQESKGVLQTLPMAPLKTAVEANLEQRSDEYAVSVDDGAGIEEEEIASDVRLSDECHGDNVSHDAIKKQKLSSRVEQLGVQGKNDSDDSRATHSNTSRAKSGSSKGCLNRHEVGEEEVIQSGRSRQNGDQKGHHHEGKRSLQRRDDCRQDGRHDMNRSRTTSKGRDDVYQSCLRREWDSTSHGRRSEGLERGKERDDSVGGCLREDEGHCRRGKDGDRKRVHDDDMGSRQSKIGVSERKVKDEDLHSRKRIGNGDRKGHHDRDNAQRQRDRDAISMSRRENFENLHVKRRKDEEQPKREKVENGDVLHGRKGREGTNHTKKEKERDNAASHKSRVEQTRLRDKVNSHLTKHQGENLRHKERDDIRLHKRNEVAHVLKERVTMHATVKGGRVLEDKPVDGVEKVNNVSKGLGLGDCPPKDRRRYSEQQKRGDHVEERSRAQHEARQEGRVHENQLASRADISKRQRFSSHSGHPLAASDGQQMSKERHRENSGKNKEGKVGASSFTATVKRKHEDQGCTLNEKVVAKGTNEQEGGDTSSVLPWMNGHNPANKRRGVQEQHHFPGNHAEEDAAYNDDSTKNGRRGRSKLERWTSASHQERDYGTNSTQPLSSSSRVRELEVSDVDVKPGDSTKTDANNDVDSEAKGAETTQIDHVADASDNHLDTVAKLKQPSERFNPPMPGKDSGMTGESADEVPLIQNGVASGADIMQERPARKRKWTNS